MTEDELAAARKRTAASPASDVAENRRSRTSKRTSGKEKPPPLWRWFSQQVAHTDPVKAQAARAIRERWDLPTVRFRQVDRSLALEDSEYLIPFRQLLDEYRVTYQIANDDDDLARQTGIGALLVPFEPDLCTCGREAIPGTQKCGRHGGQWISPEDQADLSRRLHDRLLVMAESGLRVLQDLLDNGRSEQVRMQAATAILDRAGVGPHMNVNHSGEITVTDSDAAAALVRSRIERIESNLRETQALTAGTGEVFDAEVVGE